MRPPDVHDYVYGAMLGLAIGFWIAVMFVMRG